MKCVVVGWREKLAGATDWRSFSTTGFDVDWLNKDEHNSSETIPYAA